MAEDRTADSSWLSTLRLDFQWLAFWVPNQLTQSLPDMAPDALAVALSEHGGRLKAWVRKAQRLQGASLLAWDTFQRRARADGLFRGVAWVRGQVTDPGCIACPECCEVFASGTHLSAHMHHVHKARSVVKEYAAGTRCRWCLKQYWTVNRLREHLAAGGPCLAFLCSAIPPLDEAALADADSLHLRQLNAAKVSCGCTLEDRAPPLPLLGPRLAIPVDLVANVSALLSSLSDFSRGPLWRSAASLVRLGFADLEASVDSLEVTPTKRALASPPPINPNGWAWIEAARSC